MTPARFRWGLLLILIGVLLLLVELDILFSDFWWDLIAFIPFLLIAIGIEKIFAQTRFKIISFLSTVAFVVGAFVVVISGNTPGDNGSFFRSTSIRYDPSEPVELISATLKLGDAHLTIRDAADELLYARFGEFSSKPRQSMKVTDGLAEITLTDKSDNRHFWGGTLVVNGDDENDWRLSFSRDVPLELHCDGTDSDIHLNLSTTPLRLLTLEASDANVYIKLGDIEPQAKVILSGHDSRMRLRVPEEAGLIIVGLNDSAYAADIGLVLEGERFVTEAWDKAGTQIEVELEDEFRSLSIDFY